MPRNLPGTERLTRASATMTDCREAVCQRRMEQEEEGRGGFRTLPRGGISGGLGWGCGVDEWGRTGCQGTMGVDRHESLGGDDDGRLAGVSARACLRGPRSCACVRRAHICRRARGGGRVQSLPVPEWLMHRRGGAGADLAGAGLADEYGAAVDVDVGVEHVRVPHRVLGRHLPQYRARTKARRRASTDTLLRPARAGARRDRRGSASQARRPGPVGTGARLCGPRQRRNEARKQARATPGGEAADGARHSGHGMAEALRRAAQSGCVWWR